MFTDRLFLSEVYFTVISTFRIYTEDNHVWSKYVDLFMGTTPVQFGSDSDKTSGSSDSRTRSKGRDSGRPFTSLEYYNRCRCEREWELHI